MATAKKTVVRDPLKTCKKPFTQHHWVVSYDPRYQVCGRCGKQRKTP